MYTMPSRAGDWTCLSVVPEWLREFTTWQTRCLDSHASLITYNMGLMCMGIQTNDITAAIGHPGHVLGGLKAHGRA
jgi:hypothetical protein